MMQVADGSLGQLSQLLQSIAAGDLTARMDGQFNGVFARMRDDANTTVAQLTQIVGQIQASASSITLAAGEIAPATATCRAVPSSRPPTWKKPPPRWRN
jgi:methyl-accepting chemotaxis protein